MEALGNEGEIGRLNLKWLRPALCGAPEPTNGTAPGEDITIQKGPTQMQFDDFLGLVFLWGITTCLVVARLVVKRTLKCVSPPSHEGTRSTLEIPTDFNEINKDDEAGMLRLLMASQARMADEIRQLKGSEKGNTPETRRIRIAKQKQQNQEAVATVIEPGLVKV